MNAGSQMPKRAVASVRRPGWIDTTDGCPLSLPFSGRQAIFVGGMAGGVRFAQAGPLQLNAMRTMNDTVQNCIADRRISHQFMPAADRNLAGDQQRALLVPVINNLQQVPRRCSALSGSGPQSSIISSLMRSNMVSIRGSRPSPRAVASSANSRGARR